MDKPDNITFGVPKDVYARIEAEARFWRDACLRQAELAKRDHGDSPQRMAFLLGRIAEGPERPEQGVCSLAYVKGQAFHTVRPRR